MNILAWIATILGLIASISGSWLAYLTYVSPLKRFQWYLRKTENWEEVHTSLGGGGEFYRYKKHPEFVIERQGESKDWSRDEPWMKYHYPDPHKHSRMVSLKVNGQILLSEEFIALDGGRYFVPLPRVKYAKDEKNNIYWYTPLQIQISKIIGSYYRMDSIYDFMRANDLTEQNAAKESREQAT